MRFFDQFQDFRKAFPGDMRFVQDLNVKDIFRKHEFKRVINQSEFHYTGKSKFPRNAKKNPWHMVDLEDFIIEFTKNPKIINEDAHFINFISYEPFSPCKNFYNLIIKQEFLTAELGFLTKHLKMDLKNTDISQVYHSNTATLDFKTYQSIAHLYLDPLKLTTRKLLYEYFLIDFQIFNYSWDYKTNEIKL